MKSVIKLSMLLYLNPCTAFSAQLSASWNEIKNPPEPQVFVITQYLTNSRSKFDDDKMVIISGGLNSGMVQGTTLKVVRKVPGSAQAPDNKETKSERDGPLAVGDTLWVETGRIRAIEVQPNFTVAKVESEGSSLARAFFHDFPRIMAGDVATILPVSIAKRSVLLPTVTLGYFDIFEDPKGQPTTFELSAKGLNILKDSVKIFAATRLSMLMVEGYTDHNGPSDVNQVESYQRAQTIRQILIDELGFDESRVVAIGYGELEPADDTLAPGYVQRNRRIVLKAIPKS